MSTGFLSSVKKAGLFDLIDAGGIVVENILPMALGNQAGNKVDIFGHIDQRPIGAVHQTVEGVGITQPCTQMLCIAAVFGEQGIDIMETTVENARKIGADIGILIKNCSSINDPGVAVVAEDKGGLGKISSHFIDDQRMAVFEVRACIGCCAGVDGNRLAILGRKVVQGMVEGLGDVMAVIAGIELDAGAFGAAQMVFHMSKGAGKGFCGKMAAVESNTVPQEVGVVVGLVGAIIAHDDGIFDAEFGEDLAQMGLAVFMAGSQRKGIKAGAGFEMNVGVNDFQGKHLP